MSRPFFSVVVPTFNRGHLISRTIQSVLDQTFSDFEIIVIDDGSTDETGQVIKNFDDSRILYFYKNNEERGAARNYGASKAIGHYIYFLDSDDILYSDHLSVAAKFLAAHGNLAWFFQEYEIDLGINKKKIRYNVSNPLKSLYEEGNFMSCHGVFLRRDVAVKFPFSEIRALSGSEDYLLWLQLSARYPLKINPIVTSALIEHSERSMRTFKLDDVIQRKIIFNSEVKRLLSHMLIRKQINTIIANSYSYIAINAINAGFIRTSLTMLFQSYYFNLSSLFSRRTGYVLAKILRLL